MATRQELERRLMSGKAPTAGERRMAEAIKRAVAQMPEATMADAKEVMLDMAEEGITTCTVTEVVARLIRRIGER